MSTNHLSLIDDRRQEGREQEEVFISHERPSTNYPFLLPFSRLKQSGVSRPLLVWSERTSVWALWPFGLGKAHRPPNAAPTLSLYEKEVSWQKSDLCGPPGEFQVEGKPRTSDRTGISSQIRTKLHVWAILSGKGRLLLSGSIVLK